MSDEAAAGALMALLHRAMADAARGRADSGVVAAVDIHVAFLHEAGGPVTAAARVCGGGRSVFFCGAEATDAGGRVVARSMGTFRHREAP
jgi:acyl-coenzyme A thioesterase PaaI-like protein